MDQTVLVTSQLSFDIQTVSFHARFVVVLCVIKIVPVITVKMYKRQNSQPVLKVKCTPCTGRPYGP